MEINGSRRDYRGYMGLYRVYREYIGVILGYWKIKWKPQGQKGLYRGDIGFIGNTLGLYWDN